MELPPWAGRFAVTGNRFQRAPCITAEIAQLGERQTETLQALVRIQVSAIFLLMLRSRLYHDYQWNKLQRRALPLCVIDRSMGERLRNAREIHRPSASFFKRLDPKAAFTSVPPMIHVIGTGAPLVRILESWRVRERERERGNAEG